MRIGKFILHYKREDLTRNLLKMVPDAIVIDNSQTFEGENVVRTGKNLGMTGGFNFALEKYYNDYDAFWLLTNDVSVPQGTFEMLVKHLEENPRIGIIQASVNSPWKQMERTKNQGFKYVPFIEIIAPIIRKEVFNKIGLFDSIRFPYGWGNDFDFGYKARRAGFALAVDCDCTMKHLDAKGYDNVEEYFRNASATQNAGLTELYGKDWPTYLLTTVALTMVVHNESERLEEMIDFHRPFVDEIVIAVQKSDDNTLEIAKRLADKVIETPCVGYCEADREKVHALVDSDWELCLDADEYLTHECMVEFRNLITKPYDGYSLKRRLFIDGEKKFEGDYQHRLYRKDRVKFLNELHTEPQPLNRNCVFCPEYVAINHIKTMNEVIEDESRYENLIETLYKHHPTYEAKKRLNVHLRGIV